MRFFPVIVLIVVIAAAVGLITTLPAQPAKTSKPVVATTIFPIYDITRTIAGNKLQVELLVPAGASPHTFEPNPQTAKNIQHSQIILAVGGLDDWITGLSSETPVVIIDDNITYLSYQSDHHNNDNNKTSSLDPHYWLSAANAGGIAKQIAKELSTIDPENSDYYQANLKQYQAELVVLDEELKAALAALPNKNIATFHNSWQYFSRDYGLNIVTTFEEFPGQTPGPQYLASFADALEQHNVKAVYSEPQLPIDKLVPIAQEHQVELGVLDPLGGTEDRQSYLEMMRYNKNQLEATLQ